MVRLASIATAVPPNLVTAEDVKAELDLRLPPGAATRLGRIVDATRIRKRHVIAPVADLLRLRTIEQRNDLYARHALGLCESAARSALAAAHADLNSAVAAVSVSCTGHMMPSIDAHLVDTLGISATARRIPINALGCSAGVAAVGIATSLLAEMSAGFALIVSVELSSLGLQVGEPSMSEMIGNLLFGDGAAAAVLSAEPSARGPEILASQSVLWPTTLQDLGMRLTDGGFRLFMSAALPRLLRTHLRPSLATFLGRERVAVEDIGFWVVHPGGPKILESVAQTLGISDRSLQASSDAWEQFGNLSSANVFFVLDRMRELPPAPSGQLGVMLAFGPGVSCEMCLLRSDGWLTGPR